jgi:hypothetical protein
MVFLWVETKLLKIFNNFDDIRFATSVGEKSLVPLGIPGFDAIIIDLLLFRIVRKFKLQISYF